MSVLLLHNVLSIIFNEFNMMEKLVLSNCICAKWNGMFPHAN